MEPDANILLIGPNGMLGRAWRALLDARGMSYRAVGRPELDFADPDAIVSAVTDGVDLVINCVAYTDVDGAEADEPTAMLINGQNVGVLADRCKAVDAALLHYSTDYVFNGQQSWPYQTDQPHDPINAYGRSKAQGETRVRAAGGRHLIVRASWVYAPWGRNFVRTIAHAARQRDVLRVVDDQHGRPTSAEHLAAASLALYEVGASGVHHVTDGGRCTWCGFAQAIVATVNPACTVEPCSSAEHPRAAKRPAYSVLDLSQTQKLIGPMPDWKTNLNSVLNRMSGVAESTGS